MQSAVLCPRSKPVMCSLRSVSTASKRAKRAARRFETYEASGVEVIDGRSPNGRVQVVASVRQKHKGVLLQ